MSFLLACDTTHGHCSVAVLSAAGAVLAYKEEQERDRQAERLLYIIEDTLLEAKVEYHELKAISVTTGPGSFTGIRIGLSAARGIGVALGKPVIGVSSFESILHQYLGKKSDSVSHHAVIAVILDARREHVYIQLFDHSGKARHMPCMLPCRDVLAYLMQHKQVVIIGNAGSLLSKDIHSDSVIIDGMLEPLLPEAISVGQIGYRRYHEGKSSNYPAIPLYIRAPDAVIPSKK